MFKIHVPENTVKVGDDVEIQVSNPYFEGDSTGLCGGRVVKIEKTWRPGKVTITIQVYVGIE